MTTEKITDKRGSLPKRLLKNASAYSFGVILTQSGNLFVIPILWTVFNPEDFGIIALSQIVTVFLGPVLSLGIPESIQRFYLEWKEDTRSQHVGALFLFYFCFSLLLTLILEVVGQKYGELLFKNVSFNPYLRLTLWTAFFANFSSFNIAILRIEERIKTYNFLSIGSYVVQIAFVFFYVFYKKEGVVGYLKGYFYGNALSGAVHFFYCLKKSSFPKRFDYLSRSLKYCLPLSVSSVIEGFNSIIDRIFLDKYIPLSRIGFYNLGRQFGNIINLCNTVFKLAYLPFMYRVYSEGKNVPGILSKISVNYTALICIPALALCLLSKETILIFDVTHKYTEVYKYVPYFVFVGVMVSIATVMGRGIDFAEKNHLTIAFPIVGGAVSFTLYYLLVPSMGMYGIFLGLIAGAFARYFLNVLLAVLAYPRPLFKRKMASALGISFALFFIGYNSNIEALIPSILFKLVLLGIQIFAFYFLFFKDHMYLFKKMKSLS
jgi:O-antigen/teichoic acid export membrane protein